MEQVVAKVETITPEIAKEYLKANVVNRPLNKDVVAYYAEQMRKGQWRMNGEPICFSQSGAMENGQHRLNAIIEFGGPVDILVVRGCEDGSFITYDSGRNRSISDVFALNDIPAANNVSSIVNKYLAIKNSSKARLLTRFNSIKNRKISKQDILDEYHNTPDLYQDVNKFSRACNNKLNILASSEIGSIIVFLYKEKHYDIEFIKGFFTQMYYPETQSLNVIGILRDRLLKSKLGNIKISSKLKDALIKKAWNLYASNKDSVRLSYNEEKEGDVEFL